MEANQKDPSYRLQSSVIFSLMMSIFFHCVCVILVAWRLKTLNSDFAGGMLLLLEDGSVGRCVLLNGMIIFHVLIAHVLFIFFLYWIQISLFHFHWYYQFDVTSEKGLMAFNGFMSSKSYVEGWTMSAADTELVAKMSSIPDATKLPHAFRWYRHIVARSGGLIVPAPTAVSTERAVEAPKIAKVEKAATPAAPPAAAPAPPAEEEEDDFDVFGDDDDDDKPREIANADEVTETGETRRDMLARLKKEAEERTAQKEAKQRTLVAIEIKPWDVEQDLMALWKKITTTIQQDGLKWGESCTLADVAFGIKKIQCTFVMGVKNSSDDVVEAIEAMEDEVQSVEVTSMNVL
jgi:elongation factor 1-beta